MICPACNHHTWHVDRSVHAESNDHNKAANAGALAEVREALAARGMPEAPWHYRRRTCRRCGVQARFVELPL